MSIFARFRAIEENGKAHAVRRLMESSTPDFDYFYMVGISVGMATLGLIAGSTSIVIGSMLIAPVLYPILSFSVGLVMSDYTVLTRSSYTIVKSIGLGLIVSTAVTIVFGQGVPPSEEILSRTEPSLLYLFVAVAAGMAVAFALAKPEWDESFPGIAISVALIPPLAVVGIGIASLDATIISGSLVMFCINVLGIMAASMVTFSLMNLYEKRNIAQSTIKREEEKIKEENEAISKVEAENAVAKATESKGKEEKYASEEKLPEEKTK